MSHFIALADVNLISDPFVFAFHDWIIYFSIWVILCVNYVSVNLCLWLFCLFVSSSEATMWKSRRKCCERPGPNNRDKQKWGLEYLPDKLETSPPLIGWHQLPTEANIPPWCCYSDHRLSLALCFSAHHPQPALQNICNTDWETRKNGNED